MRWGNELKITSRSSLLAVLAGILGWALVPAVAQTLPAQTSNDGGLIQNDDVRSGARTGAVAGAALGALSGNAGAGAVGGAVSGGVYMYDQSRRDDRTRMLADSISSNNSNAQNELPDGALIPPPTRSSTTTTNTQARTTSQPRQQQLTVGDVGRNGLKNLVGDWDLATWSLATDGSRLAGTGSATVLAADQNAVRIVITDFNAPDFPEATGGANVLLSYQPGRGFSLESDFAFSDEVLRFVGEYRADSGIYNFYLVGASGGETMTGVIRSSVRVEIRSSGSALWVADTFSYVDGKETQVQSYRFTRR